MKKNDFFMLLLICISMIFVSACGSQDTKASSAPIVEKEKTFVEEKESAPDTIIRTVTEPGKIVKAPDQWTGFRSEMETKILANENMIRELKKSPQQNAKWQNQLTKLEKENGAMRKTLDDFNKETKERWEKFTAKMRKDADELGKSLREMGGKTKSGKDK